MMLNADLDLYVFVIILVNLTYLIKFFVLIRGARTPPPRIDAPVTNMPLQFREYHKFRL